MDWRRVCRPGALDLIRQSSMNDEYNLQRFIEAQASVPTLGGRYRECAGALAWLPGKTAYDVFGAVDVRKLHSSLTLFAEASNYEPLLAIMLDVWFGERRDEDTMRQLSLA